MPAKLWLKLDPADHPHVVGNAVSDYSECLGLETRRASGD